MERNTMESLYDQSQFREMGHRLIDLLADHIDNTTSGKNPKTIDWAEPSVELESWKDFFNNGNADDFFEKVIHRTTHTHHPKYIGHQVGVPAPITALTGLLASLLNNGMAVYEMGMSPTAMERIVTDHICKKVGYGEASRGLLTSGGTLANLTALLSARKAKAKHNVWTEGSSQQLGIMVSEEAHYCVDRAARIMGLGDQGIIKVPVTKDFTMDTSQLENYHAKALENGVHVFAIVGSAPSTATGIYDDLEAIARFAKEKGLWFHVDGAHGGAAIFSKKYKHLLAGIEKSDSVVIDGHKMLMMPTLTTALLYREGIHSHTTFVQKADYLLTHTDEEDWYNGGKRTFECTKSMMGLHWYILLKLYGDDIFDQNVTKLYDLGKEFAQLIHSDSNFELAIEPMSNILCFRYVAPQLSLEQLNSLNQSIRQQLLEDGEFYMVQTQLRGVHYLRTSLMNPFTTMEHLGWLLEKIKTLAEKLMAPEPTL